MVSAIQCEVLGFGADLPNGILTKVNQFRKRVGRLELASALGLQYMEYGKNREGYWGFKEFEEQVVDCMDVFEVMYPEKQLTFEVNHSTGHAKNREDGLHVGYMDVRYGGAQKVLRDTKLTEGCVGSLEVKMHPNKDKGSTQFIKGVLWKRGLYVDGTSIAPGTPEERRFDLVLANLPDFKHEETALQHTVESRGHILLMSPKYHPGVAGVGIEYSWGISK
ncbi:unnamed protein product, partial [Sphacelaria rigidula]